MSHILGPRSDFSYSKISHCSLGTQTLEVLTAFSLDPKPGTSYKELLCQLSSLSHDHKYSQMFEGLYHGCQSNQWKMTR